jgi:hypothetical protein
MSNIALDFTALRARPLLAGALLLCLTLGAVPALAHCCADRCHDAEPLALTGDCDCSLQGVEPPMDALPLATEPDAALVDAGPAVAPALIAPPSRSEAPASPPLTHRRPDPTVVLLI